ncbi:glycosyltransferase family 2 protein [Methylogaea oryzae]|uniref:glycosyltransferase family 2 protein n=1 Tax=Methylogaea oryzae TaxID=1295382 RepID=UPI0012E1CE9E|nr:glycosyltransferase [Methylogaea oryzae]
MAARIHFAVLFFHWRHCMAIKDLLTAVRQRIGAVSKEDLPGMLGIESDDTPVIHLLKGVVVTQRLDTLAGEIEGLSIQFATFRRKNTCAVDAVVHTADGTVIHQERWPAGDLVDNAYRWLELAGPIPVVEGGIWLSLKSDDATPENNVAIWRAASGRSDVLLRRRLGAVMVKSRLQGQSLPGFYLSLNFQSSTSLLSYRRAAEENRPGSEKVALYLDETGGDSMEWAVSCCQQAQIPYAVVRGSESLAKVSPRIVLLSAALPTESARKVAAQSRALNVPVAILARESDGTASPNKDHWPSFADYLLAGEERALGLFRHSALIDESSFGAAIERAIESYRARRTPRMSIVTILHAKAEQIGPVLESYFRQSYKGELEIVFVDDASRSDESSLIEAGFKEMSSRYDTNGRISFKILRNEKNLGNCVSRNRALPKQPAISSS